MKDIGILEIFARGWPSWAVCLEKNVYIKPDKVVRLFGKILPRNWFPLDSDGRGAAVPRLCGTNHFVCRGIMKWIVEMKIYSLKVFFSLVSIILYYYNIAKNCSTCWHYISKLLFSPRKREGFDEGQKFKLNFHFVEAKAS